MRELDMLPMERLAVVINLILRAPKVQNKNELLNEIQPNGKRLADCTGNELRKIGRLYKHGGTMLKLIAELRDLQQANNEVEHEKTQT